MWSAARALVDVAKGQFFQTVYFTTLQIQLVEKGWKLFLFPLSSLTALSETNTARFCILCNFQLTLIMTPCYCCRIFISHCQCNRDATRCLIYIFIVACCCLLFIEDLSCKEGNKMISEQRWRTEMQEMSFVLVAYWFVLTLSGRLGFLTFSFFFFKPGVLCRVVASVLSSLPKCIPCVPRRPRRRLRPQLTNQSTRSAGWTPPPCPYPWPECPGTKLVLIN